MKAEGEELDFDILSLLAEGGGKGKAKDTQYAAETPVPIDSALTPKDMMTLIYAEIDQKKIAGHHIESMNTFNKTGIKQIATKVFIIEGRLKNQRENTDEDKSITDIMFKVEFTDINLKPPTFVKRKSGKSAPLMPNMAREQGLNYSCNMFIDAAITATATYRDGSTKVREASFENQWIASIPCLLGTELCHTYSQPHEVLKKMEEDPLSPGGVFIIKGLEWAVDNLENITNNTFHVYKNMHQKEIVRGTIISKPGDAYENSFQVILRYLTTGAITVELTTNKTENLLIPFYLLFRALGVTEDREIVNHVVYGFNDDLVTSSLLGILEKSFTVPDAKFEAVRTSIEPTKIIEAIAARTSDAPNKSIAKKDDNVAKYMNTAVLTMIDRHMFPHIGIGAAFRIKKLRFLGHLVNKLLRVYLEVLEPTDRNSYKNKRILSVGPSIAKTFKTDFNFAIVQPVKRHLTRDFRQTPFSQVNLAETVKHAINADNMEKYLVQAITTGTKTIMVKRNEVKNRISSQTLYHKNDMNVKSTLNAINTPNITASKQNEMADEMRRVHATYTGYVDPSQSPDSGEKVGVNKQMCCTVSICGPSSSFILKDLVLADPDVMLLDDVRPEQISAENLSKVFVNGDWIGCTKHSHLLAKKYRTKRRHGDIYHLTSIVWELLIREVHFWTDVGRLMRPLVIVYNNLDEYVENWRSGDRSVVFRQWIKLTAAHVLGLQSRKITMTTLREERVLEYISPEEQENMFIAVNIDYLRANEGNICRQFTHCDIDQAIFGIVTLASPAANHALATRNTYYTNHRKQAASWFALNYAFRIDKNTTLQHYCEKPVVSTFSDVLTYPNGHNCIVAIALCGGFNQEDSIILNQSSVDCGAFNASYYTYEKVELGDGEQFGNPDYEHTLDLKTNAVYEYIHTGGFIKEGTLVQKDYVLVIKTAEIVKPVDQYKYSDKSIIYRKDEPVYVERVLMTPDEEETSVVKIKLRADRPMGVGDKFCLTADHEVLSKEGWVGIAGVSVEMELAVLVDGVLEYRRPIRLYEYEHFGKMVCVENGDMSMMCTLDHKVLVDLGDGESEVLDLVAARDVVGKRVHFLKAVCWEAADVDEVLVGTTMRPANDLLAMLAQKIQRCGSDGVPGWVWSLSSRQCLAFLRLLVKEGGKMRKSVVDLASRIAVHAGIDCKVVDEKIVFGKRDRAVVEDAFVIGYDGRVYCVEVPGSVFFVRRNGKCHWTGNSCRSGNKGIVSVKRPRIDMFYCEDGTTPDLIVNPHSIPTRMVVSQLVECVLGQLAVRKGTIIDATPFTVFDIDKIIEELEQYGVKYGGHKRMFNGRTGDWLDSLIFVGPTSYQRLQKFVKDESYAVNAGLISATTRQPTEGRGKGGGLRLGEMEKDVLCAQGNMRSLWEKFYKDSDGIDLPVCRTCGDRAITNEKLSIYKCKKCGPGADIAWVSSSWVANLFFNETSSMNVKMLFNLAPFTYSEQKQ